MALKRLKGHDVEAWSRGILNGGAAKLETMDAALELLDTATSHVVVSHPAFQSTIQRELCSPDEARRAGALQVIGTAVLTTPALAVPLLRPEFVTATDAEDALEQSIGHRRVGCRVRSLYCITTSRVMGGIEQSRAEKSRRD